MTCLEAALLYLSRGIRPIPLNGKVPTLRAWQKAPMPSEADVRGWFDLHPEANIGLPVPKGVIVLDVDTLTSHKVDGLAALKTLEAEHGALPETWTGVTGSGGLHLWLRAPEDLGNARGSLPDGIDVRGGHRGQVVVWPSIHPETGVMYTWQQGAAPWDREMAAAPEWLVQLIRTRPMPVVRQAIEARPPTSRYAAAALAEEVEAVSRATAGTRNQTLNKAAYALGGLVSAGELHEGTVRAMLTTAALQAGLPAAEVDATISSGLTTGMARPREVSRFASSRRSHGDPRDTPEPQEPPLPDAPPPDLEAGSTDVWDEFVPFERDSDPCLSARLLEDLRKMHGTEQEVLYDEGDFYAYDQATGIWRAIEPDVVWRTVSGYDGKPVRDGRSKGRTRPLILKASRIGGAIKDAEKRAGRRGFFSESAVASQGGIAFQNGFVTLTQDGPTIQPFSPEHRCRATLPVPFDTDAECPRWSKFLRETLSLDPNSGDTIAMLQEFVGVCLMGIAPVYERCLVLHGHGANGKSQFLVVFNALFPPELRCAIAPQQFEREFKLASLAGKLINVVSEMPNSDMASSERFKAIVSGEPVTAEHKHRDPFTFRPRAGHLFACNALPGTPDASDGYWRRFLLVSLERQLDEEQQEKGLGAKIAATELPGIAYWAVLRAIRLLGRQRYTISASSRAAAAEWRLNSDVVMRWVDERTAPCTDGGTSPRNLYLDFKEWSLAGGHKLMAENRFSERLKKLRPQRRGHKTRYYPLVLLRHGRPSTPDILDREVLQ